MWPFGKKESAEKRGSKMVKRVIVGFVIGGAISSIIGKKLLHRDEDTEDEDEDEDDDDEDEQDDDDEDDDKA